MKKTIYQFALIFITLSFLTACTGNIDSESENKGIQHYKNGEYQKAIPLLEKAEDGGSSSAAFYLGEIFRKGEGVNQDFGRSCTHYIKSAKGGNNNAYLLAGSCFVMGKGVKQDFAEALKWFKKASDESEKTDLTESDKKYLTRSLATMYYSGKTSAKPQSGRKKRLNWVMRIHRRLWRSCFIRGRAFWLTGRLPGYGRKNQRIRETIWGKS